jgi:uncharacterized protein (DUF2336 family)
MRTVRASGAAGFATRRSATFIKLSLLPGNDGFQSHRLAISPKSRGEARGLAPRHRALRKRRQVSELHQVVEHLHASLESRSCSERLRMLRSVTELFVGGAAHFSEAQIELFDEVLCRLVQYVADRALAQLSAELAPIDTAPPNVVRRLAWSDNIAISGPLLKQSKRLRVPDLVEIARTKSDAHLFAIGRRSQIDEAVTDILVKRGQVEIVRAIAKNTGARFSQDGFSRLVRRAETDDGLAELVAVRSEISSEQLHRLVGTATEIVRRRLVALAKPEARQRIEKVLFEIGVEIDRPDIEQKRDYSPAKGLVDRIGNDPTLLRSMLVEVAKQNEFEAAVVLLATLANLSVPAVERIMNRDEAGGALLLCRAIDLKWPTVLAVLSVHATASTAGAAQLDRMSRQFAKLDAVTAQRVVRLWRMRSPDLVVL